MIINPILFWVDPRKWGWPDLPHSNGNLSNCHSASHSIQGILPLQTNTLALPLLFNCTVIKFYSQRIYAVYLAWCIDAGITNHNSISWVEFKLRWLLLIRNVLHLLWTLRTSCGFAKENFFRNYYFWCFFFQYFFVSVLC